MKLYSILLTALLSASIFSCSQEEKVEPTTEDIKQPQKSIAPLSIGGFSKNRWNATDKKCLYFPPGNCTKTVVVIKPSSAFDDFQSVVAQNDPVDVKDYFTTGTYTSLFDFVGESDFASSIALLQSGNALIIEEVTETSYSVVDVNSPNDVKFVFEFDVQ
jgi:hypothetical protein